MTAGGTEGKRAEADAADGRFLDEELIPVLVLVGVLLILFPEPITSALGVVLVGIGVALWLRDLLS